MTAYDPDERIHPPVPSFLSRPPTAAERRRLRLVVSALPPAPELLFWPESIAVDGPWSRRSAVGARRAGATGAAPAHAPGATGAAPARAPGATGAPPAHATDAIRCRPAPRAGAVTGAATRPRRRDRGIVRCACAGSDCPLIRAMARMVRAAVESERATQPTTEDIHHEAANRT
jgi:hypothetical protein